MRPLHLVPIFFLVAIVAGLLVYASYPLDADESYGIMDVAFANESVEGVPGFAAGAASVSAKWSRITLEGVVVGHGFIEVKEARVPFMKIDTGGEVYIVVIGKRVAGQIVGSGDIVEMPMMMGHRVIVDGLLLEGRNIVVARSVSMSVEPMGPMGPMHDMPAHGGRNR